MLRDLYKQYCDDPAAMDAAATQALRIVEGTELSAMRFQAELYRHWAQLAIIAADDAAKLKDHVKEVVFADCHTRATATLTETGEKITLPRVDALAKRDPIYADGLSDLRIAETRAAEFKAVEQALWQKKEMLQSINARQCKELSSL